MATILLHELGRSNLIFIEFNRIAIGWKIMKLLIKRARRENPGKYHKMYYSTVAKKFIEQVNICPEIFHVFIMAFKLSK